jgi:hypothetical protein
LKAQASNCEDFVTIVKLGRIISKFCRIIQLIAARSDAVSRLKIIDVLGLELLGRIPI